MTQPIKQKEKYEVDLLHAIKYITLPQEFIIYLKKNYTNRSRDKKLIKNEIEGYIDRLLQLTPEGKSLFSRTINVKRSPKNYPSSCPPNIFKKQTNLNTDIKTRFVNLPDFIEWAWKEEFYAHDYIINHVVEIVNFSSDFQKTYKQDIKLNNKEQTNNSQLEIFQSMENLLPEEITLTILSSNTLAIEARSKKKKLHFSEVGLYDTHGKKPNRKAIYIIALSKKITIESKSSDKKVISRIRTEFFKTYLGIETDPFSTKTKTASWNPKFKVIDNRSSADIREKDKAIMVEYEDITGKHGYDEFDEDEDDNAGKWLKENTPK